MKYSVLFVLLSLFINSKTSSQSINRNHFNNSKYAYLHILTEIIIDSSKDTLIRTSNIKLVLLDNGKSVDTLKYNYSKNNLKTNKIISDINNNGWVVVKKIISEQFEENISLSDIDKYVIINSYLLQNKN
jgi:hypothetical protein